MPSHLKRYYGADHLHFLTCSCYHRQPWLAQPRRRDLFLKVLEQVRQRYGFVVVGYVIMPEHIHLLISEPEKDDPSGVVQAVKQGFARHVLRPWRLRRRWGQGNLFPAETAHVWQKRFYDFNVWSGGQASGEAALYASQSGKARASAGAGAMDVEQLPQLCFRGSGSGEDQ